MNNKVKILVVLVMVIVILAGCSGCLQPVNLQPTQVVILSTSTIKPTEKISPTNTFTPTFTSTPSPTYTQLPTNTPIPTETSTPTLVPRMWTYEQRQIFWRKSGAGVIVIDPNYLGDPLVPKAYSRDDLIELEAQEIPADYLCAWLYNLILNGLAFPEVEDRYYVWHSSAIFLGSPLQEPYCLEFDLTNGFNP